MKATGIVRRIDDLGRVVIPKEIRRTLRLREGTPLEIFTDREGEIILKKYSPMVELTAEETDPEDPQRVLDEIVETVPVGRFGKPEEIGYLAAFLASDEAAYITGSEFVIDGGSTLPETISVGR